MKLECQICCKAELSNMETADGLTLVDILYCENCGLVEVRMTKMVRGKK